jgi:hypothetical protein
MQALGGFIYVVFAGLAAVAVGGSALGCVASLAGTRSRQRRVRRSVALVGTGLVSGAVAVGNAFGCYYLATFRGIGFAAEYGIRFGLAGASIGAIAAGFAMGRIFSRRY